MRVGVDDENPQVVGSQSRCKVNRGGRLTDSTFLVGYGEDLAQAVMLTRILIIDRI